MSGQDIIIEQLRAEVERLRDDRADLQERCNRLTGERNTALLMMKDEEARAEKAERFIATADSEWKARAEKAEDERDEARAEREREERLEALGRAIVEASRFFQDADDIALSEDVTIWEDDCHGGDHRTVLIMDDNQHALLADVSEAVATYREETAGVDVRSDEIKELRKRAEKAERERDEARAERDALHVALELAEVEVALDRSWCRICRTECRGAHRGRREHMHAAECVLNIRAHAAKAVNP